MVTEKTGKISGLDYVDKVVDMVNNHPNIAKKDRWKVTIALLEPMLEKVLDMNTNRMKE